MGITKIKANLDRNIIHGEYIRRIDVGESILPVDLTVKLLHQYITPNETLQELELHSFTIPADYLDTSNGLFGTTVFEQTATITLGNPSYLVDLFIEILEVRDSSAVTTRVPVLDSTEEARELTPQPIKYDDFEENIPKTVAVYPIDNISTPEPIAITVLYTLAKDGIKQKQGSSRAYFEPAERIENDLFRTQQFNEKIDRIFVENSITNLLPNPLWLPDPDDGDRPEKYVIDSPGIVVVSNLRAGDITGTNQWIIRASNTNPFNAFDNIKIEITDPVALQPGIQALTISFYHKLASDTINLAVSSFSININFFNVTGDVLSTRKIIIPAVEIERWTPLFATVQSSQIPLNAVTFDAELELQEIDATDTFQLNLYLPQAEAIPYYTTRALPERIQDRYVTTAPVQLTLPLFFQLKTTHIYSPGRRGLASTTTNDKDGFQFLTSTDRMRFILFNSAGVSLFNIGSAPITVPEGQVVNYGLYIDGTTVEFYLDGVLVSAHTQTFTVSQTVEVIIGSLEASNTGINAELLDFKILRDKP